MLLVEHLGPEDRPGWAGRLSGRATPRRRALSPLSLWSLWPPWPAWPLWSGACATQEENPAGRDPTGFV